MNQTLTAVQDPVADALDEMAALGVHWTRNRERGRMPSEIRQACYWRRVKRWRMRARKSARLPALGQHDK